MNGYGLVAVKRTWVPEWVWWWACHPIPFWNNEWYPLQLANARPWRWILTTKPVRLVEGE